MARRSKVSSTGSRKRAFIQNTKRSGMTREDQFEFVYAFMFGLVLRLSEVFQKPGFIMNYEWGVNGQSTQNLFTFNDIPLLLFFS